MEEQKKKINRKLECDQLEHRTLTHGATLTFSEPGQEDRGGSFQLQGAACVYSMCSSSSLTRVLTMNWIENAICTLNIYYIFRKHKWTYEPQRIICSIDEDVQNKWELRERNKIYNPQWHLSPLPQWYNQWCLCEISNTSKALQKPDVKYVCKSLTMWWVHIYMECLNKIFRTFMNTFEYPQNSISKRLSSALCSVR